MLVEWFLSLVTFQSWTRNRQSLKVNRNVGAIWINTGLERVSENLFIYVEVRLCTWARESWICRPLQDI